MKLCKWIALVAFVVLTGFFAGCSFDASAGAAQDLPAEVAKAIAAGEVAHVDLTPNTRAVTGTVSGQPVLYPTNYPTVALRDTPAIRIKVTLSASYSTFDTYIFYVNSLPAITVKSTDYPNVIDGNSIAAFLARPAYGANYSVTVYCLKSSGFLVVSGSYSYSVKLMCGGKLLFDPDCSMPGTYINDNSQYSNSSDYKNLRIALTGGTASYSVYKADEWQWDADGFAGGCAYSTSQNPSAGCFTGLLAYPDASPKIFPDAAKIGIAYRLCDYPGYVWSAWGYGETCYNGNSPRRQSVRIGNSTIGMQISLYMC